VSIAALVQTPPVAVLLPHACRAASVGCWEVVGLGDHHLPLFAAKLLSAAPAAASSSTTQQRTEIDTAVRRVHAVPVLRGGQRERSKQRAHEEHPGVPALTATRVTAACV
jgi:hypothetical protein